MSRNFAFVAVLLLFLLPGHYALAKCPGDLQHEMNQCAAEKADQATKAMKVAYNKIFATLENEDRVDLHKSQVAWIQYMRSWCMASTSSSKGGSIRPLEIAICQEFLTRNRERELKSL